MPKAESAAPVKTYKTMAPEDAQELIVSLEVLSESIADVHRRINILFEDPAALSKKINAVSVLGEWLVNQKAAAIGDKLPSEIIHIQSGLDIALVGIVKAIAETNKAVAATLSGDIHE